MDGEFWHGKDWPTRKERLNRNREYWVEKIEENIARDQRNDKQLQQLGWTPVHFWEKDVLKQLQDCVDQIDELALAQLIDQTEDFETHELDEL